MVFMKKNTLREKILENNYIELIDKIKMSERNRDIIKKIIAGSKYSEVAKEYNLSAGRIRTIAFEYYRHCYHFDKRDR